MKTPILIPAVLLLGTFISCSSGGDTPIPIPPAPTYATRLAYTEPAVTGWRFVRVSGTGATTDPLILELRGPASTQVKGAAFFMDLGASSRAVWHALNGAAYATASPNMGLNGANELQKDKLAATELQVGTFRKTGTADAASGVVRVALKLRDGLQATGDLTGISLRNTLVLDAAHATSSPSFALGTLRAE